MTEIKSQINWFEWFKPVIPIVLGWLPFASGWTWIKDRPVFIAWAVLFGVICTTFCAGILLWKRSANWKGWMRAIAAIVITATIGLGVWAAIKAPSVIPGCGCYRNTFFWRRNVQPQPTRRFNILLPKISASGPGRTVGEHLAARLERQLRNLNQQISSKGIRGIELQFLSLPQELPANDSAARERMKKYLACTHQGDYIVQGRYDDQGQGEVVVSPTDNLQNSLPAPENEGKIDIQATKQASPNNGMFPSDMEIMEKLADYLAYTLYGSALFQLGENITATGNAEVAAKMYKESAELLENAQTEARDFDSLETRLSPLYKKTDLVARAHGVFLLGNVRVRLKELAQAIARYDELIGLLKLNEKWEDKRLFYTAVYNRGVARYFQAFDWERDSNDQAARQAYKQARDDFRKVVDDKGENNDAGYARNLAGYRAEILAGNYAQAASDFQTARSLITAPPRTNARLLFLLDDYADALLNELDRNSSLADLVKDQLAQQAILAYREAIKLNPEWEADALYSIAVAVWHKSQCKQGRGNCAAVCQELKAATQASRPPSPKTKSDIEKLSSDCNCK